MENYNKAIEHMRCEMSRNVYPLRKYYREAIEAMERLSPITPMMDGVYFMCPTCGEEFVIKSWEEVSCGERICTRCGQHLAWEDKHSAKVL